MRGANPTTTTTTTIKLWKSPITFLFGSLAIVVLLIVVSLVMLVCSNRKSSGNSPNQTEEKRAKDIGSVLDAEPKIVVVMAGNDKPTCLANPATITF